MLSPRVAQKFQCHLKLLGGVGQKSTKTLQVIAIALCCLPEPEGKRLLLKTAHSSDTALGGIKMELSLLSQDKLLKYWKVLYKVSKE